MYEISKEFKFDAAHCLDNMPEGHPCKRLHGHSYRVRITLERAGGLDHLGMVVDYHELKPLGAFIDDKLDHRNLNDVLPEGTHATAENLARYLYDVAKQILVLPPGASITEVAVSETLKTWAAYRPWAYRGII